MIEGHDALALKTCPFCGGAPHIYKDNYGKVMVQCEGCKAMTPEQEEAKILSDIEQGKKAAQHSEAAEQPIKDDVS